MLETLALGSLGAAIIGQPIRSLWQRHKGLRHTEAAIGQLQAEKAQLETVLKNLPPQQQQQLLASVPMQTPPAFAIAWEYIERYYHADSGIFPLGWVMNHGEPSLVCASVTPYVRSWTGHVLLTGYTRFGKDTLAFGALWSLCMRNRPEDLQLVYIDGKRSDGGLWAGLDLAHLHCEPCLGPEDVPAAMRMLRELREERERQRVAERVTEWKDLPDAVRPPQIVVYISELSLLEAGCSKADPLEKWLTRELSSALASGITYIIGAQNVSNWATSWRDHCQTAIAGYRDKEREVAPNLGITPAEVEERGGISPHRFEGRGFFTLRNGQALATVRISNITLEERRNCLAQLPRRVGTPTLLVEAAPISVAVTEAIVSVVQAAAPTPLVEAAPARVEVASVVQVAHAPLVQAAALAPVEVAPAPLVQATTLAPTAEQQRLALLLGLRLQDAIPTVIRSQLAAARRLLHAMAPHVPFTVLLTLAYTQRITIWDALPLVAAHPAGLPLPSVKASDSTPPDPTVAGRVAGRPWRDYAGTQAGRRRSTLRTAALPPTRVVAASSDLPTRDMIERKLTSGTALTPDEIRQAVTAGWYSINQLVVRRAVPGSKGIRRKRLEAIVAGDHRDGCTY